MQNSLRIAFILFLALNASACLWDSDTLKQERVKSPDLASAILGESKSSVDTTALRERIQKLQSNQREADAAWWNDLAGAHLRLGEAKEAAALLESVLNRFPDDYGIHANLGTAYHLMGRYQEAEKEIARDLELNPDAHFGLEKYHLALLQYLVRDKEYQKNHVYVDEFSEAALHDKWENLGLMYRHSRDFVSAMTPDEIQKLPAYRTKWDLAENTNFQSGVIYMATVNPREPACFVMLGVACLVEGNRDLNLAIAAFQKAIDLGSPQSEILKGRIAMIESHFREARANSNAILYVVVPGVCLIPVVVILLLRLVARSRKQLAKA